MLFTSFDLIFEKLVFVESLWVTVPAFSQRIGISSRFANI